MGNKPKNDKPEGKVVAIAVRTAVNGPMKELSEAHATAAGGLEMDLRVQPQRGITFLAKEQWEEVTRELGVELPWHTRRANVLVEGLRLADLIGKTIRFGDVEVAVRGETDPCSVMDREHSGLRAALTPAFRGGVHGRVMRGGTFRVGDAITVHVCAFG
ncbi:MAG: MOSC domain-containing protein [Planctomycetes bacterium]|nr:MOSC domain-containing protein [Planctomycetota bacterium]